MVPCSADCNAMNMSSGRREKLTAAVEGWKRKVCETRTIHMYQILDRSRQLGGFYFARFEPLDELTWSEASRKEPVLIL